MNTALWAAALIGDTIGLTTLGYFAVVMMPACRQWQREDREDPA